MKSKYVEKMERIMTKYYHGDMLRLDENRPKIDIASLEDDTDVSDIEAMMMPLEKKVLRGKWAKHFLETGVSDGSIDFISVGYRGSKEEFDQMLRRMVESGKQAEIELAKNHENHECGVCDG